MSKSNTVVISDIYSGPEAPGAVDRFLSSFGYWTNKDNASGLEYKSDPNQYTLEDPGSSVNYQELYTSLYNHDPQIVPASAFTNHMIVVPTEGGEEVIKSDEIHRLSVYKVKSKQGIDPINVALSNTRFQHMVHRYDMPKLYEEIRDLSRQGLDAEPVEVDVNFNYYRESIKYEQLAIQALTEHQIPNYYEVMNQARLRDSIRTEFDISKMFEEKTNEYYGDSYRRKKFSNIFIPPENIGFYTQSSKKLNSTEDRKKILDSHTVIKDAIPQDVTSDYPNLLPYHVRININSKQPELSKKFIVDNYMFFSPLYYGQDDLIKGTTDRLNEYEKFDLGSLLMRWVGQHFGKISKDMEFISNSPTIDKDGNNTNNVRKTQFRGFDLLEWLNEYAPALLATSPYMSFVGPSVQSSQMADPSRAQLLNIAYAIKRILVSLAGIPPVRNSSTGESKYVNILESLPSYEYVARYGGEGITETLFYKIEKFDSSDRTTAKPIQSYYIPAVKALAGNLDFIDTQVVYGKRYRYVIKEYKACYGFEYEYVLDMPNANSNLAPDERIIAVKQYPRVKIIEVPIYEKTGRVLGNPPLPPEFDLIPVRRQGDKFRLLFKPTYGKMTTRPIALTDRDKGFFQDIITNSSLYKDKIIYDDMSTVVGYSIFYSLQKPRDPKKVHEDLNNRIFTSVSTVSKSTDLIPNSITVPVALIPNTKYYFSFVARNRLGMTSYPTQVYEFEIIKDSGYSYLEFKELTYTQEELNEFTKETKTATKIFSVRPSISQVNIDYAKIKEKIVSTNGQSVGAVSSLRRAPVSIGSRKEKVFPNSSVGEVNAGKKFKLRIKSKKTNKIFDINIVFKHERVASRFDNSVPVKRLQEQNAPKPSGTSAEQMSIVPMERPAPNGLGGSNIPQRPVPPERAFPPLNFFYDNPSYDA